MARSYMYRAYPQLSRNYEFTILKYKVSRLINNAV
jgi:hypothetical protein